MGVNEVKNLQSLQLSEKIARNYFDFQYVIGRGGFGKVAYAVKELSKVKVIDKKSEPSIKMEKEILSLLPKHPFIGNMVYSFQDRDYIYFLLDLLSGGDLRYHYGLKKLFTEKQTTCVILGLEHIHQHEILHRDIKPENLVCDENGYVRITDFGIAKRYIKYNYKHTSGTLGYMAPEVLNGENHSYSVDYFALGVIGYEFMLGRRPYRGKTRNEIREDIVSHQPFIDQTNLPRSWSMNAALFINKLIQRNPKHRFYSSDEIKKHSWFDNFNWSDLMNKTMKSPFKIKKRDNFDWSFCQDDKPIGLDTLERYKNIRKDLSYDVIFRNFSSKIVPDELLCPPRNHRNKIKEKFKLTVKSKNNSRIKLDVIRSENGNMSFNYNQQKTKCASSVDIHKSMNRFPNLDVRKVIDTNSKGANVSINHFLLSNNNNINDNQLDLGLIFDKNMLKLPYEKKIFQKKLKHNAMILERDHSFLFVPDEKHQKQPHFSVYKNGYMKLYKKTTKQHSKNKIVLNQMTYDNSSVSGVKINNSSIIKSISNNK